MGLWSALLQYRAEARNPADDYWFTPIGFGVPTLSGIAITTETAMKLGVVFRCVSIIAGAVAALPLKLYRVMEDGSKQEARNHPLWDVLHDDPNEAQDAYQFREFMQTCLLLRGNAYAEIVPGPRGPVDQLVPLHPDHVTIEELPTGRRRYQVRREDGRQETLPSERIFHLMGLSLDGKVGLSVISYARETLGLGLSQEAYAAQFFGQGTHPSGVLKHPGKLKPETHQRLRADWAEKHQGLANAHKPVILEEGMEWQAMSLMTAEDAQLVASREFSVSDIATRWFGIPNHLVGETTRETSWGTGIEQIGIGFVTYTLSFWLKRWEARIRKQLILAPERFFAEFEIKGLLRGDFKTRMEGYQIAIQNGIMQPNEARAEENLNADPRLNFYLVPANMNVVTEQGVTPAMRQQPLAPASPSGQSYFRLLVEDQARRVVRRELHHLGREARRCASDSEAWRAAVEAFYAEHVGFVMQALRLEREDAERYCQEQQLALLRDGASVMDDWQTRRVDDLVNLALETSDATADAA